MTNEVTFQYNSSRFFYRLGILIMVLPKA